MEAIRRRRRCRYPWVFLDNGVLDDNFRQLTTAAARGPTRYGTIPARHWSYPPWIPTWAAAKARQAMVRAPHDKSEHDRSRHGF